MRGVQDRKQKKKQDLQVLGPFPGCLGRMINMFDLSNGVVATKMLTEKAHRDGMRLRLLLFPPSCYARLVLDQALMQCSIRLAVSPAGKDRGNAFKMAIGPFSSQIEDKKVGELSVPLCFLLLLNYKRTQA